MLPIIILAGMYVSTFLVAWRTGSDFEENLLIMGIDGPISAITYFVFLALEGVNFPALLELTQHTLNDFNPSLLIEKILTIPLPGSLVDKPPQFNQLVVQIIDPSASSNTSVNTGLHGMSSSKTMP